jgi:hypothetical protein
MINNDHKKTSNILIENYEKTVGNENNVKK